MLTPFILDEGKHLTTEACLCVHFSQTVNNVLKSQLTSRKTDQQRGGGRTNQWTERSKIVEVIISVTHKVLQMNKLLAHLLSWPDKL